MIEGLADLIGFDNTFGTEIDGLLLQLKLRILDGEFNAIVDPRVREIITAIAFSSRRLHCASFVATSRVLPTPFLEGVGPLGCPVTISTRPVKPSCSPGSSRGCPRTSLSNRLRCE